MADNDDAKTEMHMSLFERRINLYGLPIVLLGLVIYGGNTFCHWIAPKADAVISGHVTFMDKAGKAIEEQAVNGAALAKQAEIQSQILNRQEQRINEIHHTVVRLPSSP